jgi:hypothetical protein
VIEMGKEYRTREGSPVRLYTVQGANTSMPVVGERLVHANVWYTSQWDTQGRWNIEGTEHKYDLIEVKPVRVFERWVNVHHNGHSSWYRKREDADAFATEMGRIACLHIRQEYREGDGLSCQGLLNN